MQRFLFLINLLFTCAAQAQNGNVGIGTTSPAEKLHVAGNIKADTLKPNAFKLTADAATGKVLTSDAAGNASWQTVSGNNATAAPTFSAGYGVWGDCATNAIIGNYQPVTDTSGSKNISYGSKTMIAGNYAIVSAPYENVGNNTNQGTATILQYNGTSWVAVQKLTDAGGRAYERFGNSVTINDSFAAVSSFQSNTIGTYTTQGLVIIYKRTGTGWVPIQRFTDSTGNIRERFGSGLCLSGNTLVIGAPGKNTPSGEYSGAVFIYQYNGSTWVYKQMLTDPTARTVNYLGECVSMSGNYIVAGELGLDLPAGVYARQGNACVFVNNNGTWALQQKIVGPDGAVQDLFGDAVSISGNNLIVGARNASTAFIYRLSGSNWILQQRLNEIAGSSFGISVCLSGNHAIIGASGANTGNGDNTGAAYIYANTGGMWQKVHRVADPAGATGDYIGLSVYADGVTRIFCIGAPGYNTSMGKALFGKLN